MGYFISTQDKRTIVAPDGHIVAKASSAKDAELVVRALIVVEIAAPAMNRDSKQPKGREMDKHEQAEWGYSIDPNAYHVTLWATTRRLLAGGVRMGTTNGDTGRVYGPPRDPSRPLDPIKLPALWHAVPPTSDHERAAYALGVEHALDAASWVIDGNTSQEHIARMVAMLENGDPEAYDYLPRRPDLSGEYADDMTPVRLYGEIIGYNDAGGIDDEDGETTAALCDAYESGVDDTFEHECERILHSALVTS